MKRALPGPERWNDLAFEPGGKHLIALSDNGAGAALAWDVDPDRWKQRACSVASRSLTKDEWEELLAGRRYQPACR